jgi:hypothetical protein
LGKRVIAYAVFSLMVIYEMHGYGEPRHMGWSMKKGRCIPAVAAMGKPGKSRLVRDPGQVAVVSQTQ